MDTPVVIVLVIALMAAIGVAAWLYLQKRRSDGLRQSFGPEYDRARRGASRSAQRRAGARGAEGARRAASYSRRCRPMSAIGSSSAGARPRPSSSTTRRARRGWRMRSIGEIMQARGYPVGDFEQRAADVSVDHPRVVEHYRAAHAIALRTDRGQADRVIPRICGRPLSTIGRCSTTSSRSRRQHPREARR